MNTETVAAPVLSDVLSRVFLLDFPKDSARELDKMSFNDAKEVVLLQPVYILKKMWAYLSPENSRRLFVALPEEKALELLSELDPHECGDILGGLGEEPRENFLKKLKPGLQKELRGYLKFPEGTAGKLMNTRYLAFPRDVSVETALKQIKESHRRDIQFLYLIDREGELIGEVDMTRLALADTSEILGDLSRPAKYAVSITESQEEVANMIERYQLKALPVLNIDRKLVGVIEGREMVEVIREDLAADLQTMVGASKEERALSKSMFAVKKRLPWLQINLLTAFAASAVVGMFENTIAKFTALAVLLPIAAGQSGNAGAQALAVTMRSLTLREITVRHWFKVVVKELNTGMLNGLGTAVTCGIGVYFWSKSFGLALVLAAALVISLTAAGLAGALVPILLQKWGQDPAQSSSIILTTVTDIVGFSSFLGIATLFASFL